ncbi:NAD(P)/FAD-dependent oxidoreductase [Nocardioides mangrovicus]|uniref:NAD(P)/FAD-dependent oxidoreductase n=1 Tax=Nocardioides mangrovicus TaxID=2478913 RepID=A0A3L8P399_9ACTN|nr:FAD-dependent oxidoreductase [Nocardioides mangrovicus]RLV49333.1 NAD(P)/FAD-dependent oxidoreductase [Nocardioides mangrovicus]
MNDHPDHIVVVGGGLAAGTAVTELRSNGFDGDLTLFTDEQWTPYERPPLSKDILLGDGTEDDALMHPASWYADHDVDLRLGTKVTSLDTAARVVTAGDEQVRYDRLLLATGSWPRAFAPAADAGPAVAYLRTLEESRRIKDALEAGARVGIVGAGWIGLEVAAAARAADASVTVFESLDQPLLNVLGADVGRIFADVHRAHDVDLRLGARITDVARSGDGVTVSLADGDPVRCDLLVIGTGVEPVVEPAGAAGLTIDDGIRTDAHLRTSDPYVYAAGDVANADHPVLGRPLRVAHWDTAGKHGAVAAANLVGGNVEHRELPYFFTDQYDLGMEYVGHAGPDDYDRVVLRGQTSGDDLLFTAWWLQGRRIVAGMHVNDWDAIDEVKRLVGTDVDPERLADEGTALGEV